MKDYIGLVHEFGKKISVEDRVDDVVKVPVGFQCHDIVAAARGEIIDHNHLMALAQ